MMVGYERISTDSGRQSVDLQRDALIAGQPVTLQVDQILIDPGSSNLGAEREALQMATAEDEEAMAASRIAQTVAASAGVAPDDVIIDPQHHRAVVQAKALPGLSLAGWRALETRASASAPGWSIGVVPPLSALPTLRFADGSDSINGDAQASLTLSLWAARRWNVAALGVPGLPDGEPSARPRLNQRRALAVAAAVREGRVAVVPAGGCGQQFALVIAPASAAIR